MTEKELRQKVVSIFESWLGWSEKNGKFQQILDIYNSHKPLARGYKVKATDEWCATATSACFIKAGLTDIAPTECGCGEMVKLHQKLGTWVEDSKYVPTTGDIIMYDWQAKDGWPDHVGVVVSVTGNTIKVIEGNKGEAVAYRELPVGHKYIRGYCTPDYKKHATEGLPVAPKAFLREYNKEFTVTGCTWLNMRKSPGTGAEIVKALKGGSKVKCYGYYTKYGTTDWLYVKDYDGAYGFMSKKYLK